MKLLKCQNPKCNGKTYKSGAFCLDCGMRLVEVITSGITVNMLKTSKSSDTIKRDIRRWLARIGVQQPDINIETFETSATVTYILNNTKYVFRSHLQERVSDNLAAVEMFLHNRVIGIERGIETTEQAFKGYEALPNFAGDENPYDVLGIAKTATIDDARAKYKELAKQYHPDLNKNAGATELFQRIQKAMANIESMGASK